MTQQAEWGDNTVEADICLFLEGTYPYVSGGVSSWIHQLITALPHYQFHLVALVPRGAKRKLRYTIPDNVASLTVVTLQEIPHQSSRLSHREKQKLFTSLEMPLLNIQSHGQLKHLRSIIDTLRGMEKTLGHNVLMDSEEAWNMLLRMYHAEMGDNCFLDYFWSWRALMGGLFSVLMAPLPSARCYHALCTGYAGLFLARAKLETNRPCLLTEHGIYTNERRIEISLADWLEDDMSLNLSSDDSRRGLRDFWMDTFTSYSRICYESCNQIITLYQGNKEFQLADDADPERIMIIPNGINVERYASLVRDEKHPPTIALIGRVVPIKDVRSFIRACAGLKDSVRGLKAYVMGPEDEDKEYYAECVELVKRLGLKETIIFTGKVDIAEYLPRIDVVVLTSLSEAQPLVLLEAGAAGIPVVATDVGACREIIEGVEGEFPPLGVGGVVCPLSNASAVSRALERLLRDDVFYRECSHALQQRVMRYYHETDQFAAYQELYRGYIAVPELAA